MERDLTQTIVLPPQEEPVAERPSSGPSPSVTAIKAQTKAIRDLHDEVRAFHLFVRRMVFWPAVISLVVGAIYWWNNHLDNINK